MIFRVFKNLLLHPKIRVFFELFLFFLSHILVAYFFYSSIKINFLWIVVSIFFSFCLCCLGQDIGAHRLFSHQSFKTGKVVSVALLLLETLGCYGSALDWRISHLTHHQYSDTSDDPTNPKVLGLFFILSNLWKLKALDHRSQNVVHFQNKIYLKTKDLSVLFFHEYYLVIISSWLLLLFLVGNIMGIVLFFSIPMLYSAYVLNLISYLNHTFGDAPSEKSQARNFLLINTFLPGAGWHKNHHENPKSYRFNHKYDLGGLIIEKFLMIKDENKI